jgi:F420-non-reducing hydrogenase iron-sulfur subunit
MRLRYPDSIRIIRVPCTGKVDVIHILRFENGNLRARRRVEQAKTILNAVGVGGDRVEMFNLSSGEGPRFAEYAVEMTDKIREMGPNPIKRFREKQAA